MTITTVQPPLDIFDHWPCKLPLGTPGYCCVWKPIKELRRILNHSRIPRLLEMTVDDLITLVMEPLTFGPETSTPISQRLSALAGAAAVEPRSAVLCLLAAEAIPPGSTPALIDLSSEEVSHG